MSRSRSRRRKRKRRSKEGGTEGELRELEITSAPEIFIRRERGGASGGRSGGTVSNRGRADTGLVLRTT